MTAEQKQQIRMGMADVLVSVEDAKASALMIVAKRKDRTAMDVVIGKKGQDTRLADILVGLMMEDEEGIRNIIMTAAGKYLAQAGDSENLALVSFIRGWKKRFAEVSEILKDIERHSDIE
jgi:transcription antitermination factor NusA-like protein